MRIILASVLFALLCVSCAGTSNKEEQAAIEKEVLKNDSIAVEIEKAKTDLDKSISQVDSLVNEL